MTTIVCKDGERLDGKMPQFVLRVKCQWNLKFPVEYLNIIRAEGVLTQ